MCCVTPTERSSRAPARALCARCARGCSTRVLAHRLRRIGDQLEKRWAAGNKSRGPQNRENRENRAASLRNIHVMCAAIQVTVLVLLVGKRHL